MTPLHGFRRADGSFGIRNHLFTLPAVVCANQVGIDVAMRYPQLKYIEHQHGCAQIGADLIQTRHVFSQFALHPNVYGSMMVSLGCEGLVARELFNKISSKATKPLELVVIQESGGTLKAEEQVERWIRETERQLETEQREPMNWGNLTIGLMFDNEVSEQTALLKKVLAALDNLGVRLVIPATHQDLTQGLSSTVSNEKYGYASPAKIWAIEPGTNVLETATGLTAAGAHALVHLTTKPHAFGSPLSPTIRWCLDAKVYSEFFDDFDGPLRDELDIPRLTEKLARIVNGEPCVAESLGMDDFALYRIGPTV